MPDLLIADEFCNDCETTADLEVVIIHDCSTETTERVTWTFCRDCLTDKNLFCVRHGEVKLCLYDPSIAPSAGGILGVLSACPDCALEKMRLMAAALRHHYAGRLREKFGDDWAKGMFERFVQAQVIGLSEDEALMYVLALTADLHNSTLEVTVSDLLSERADRPLN